MRRRLSMGDTYVGTEQAVRGCCQLPGVPAAGRSDRGSLSPILPGLTCRSMCSSMKLVLSRMSKPSRRAAAEPEAASPYPCLRLQCELSLPPQAPGNRAGS